jgi:hypothetical protein
LRVAQALIQPRVTFKQAEGTIRHGASTLSNRSF